MHIIIEVALAGIAAIIAGAIIGAAAYRATRRCHQ